MTTAAAPTACTVCSEPSEGGACCGRCGYPYAPGTVAQAMPAPPPPAPAPRPAVKPGQKSALADLEAEFTPTLPTAGSSSALTADESPVPSPLPQASPRETSHIEAPAGPPTPKTSPRRAATPPPLLPAGLAYVIQSGLSIAFLLGLATAICLLLLYQHQSQNVQSVPPRLARRYLTALATTDYATAYYILSSASQARCTMEDFRKLRGPGEWSWDNLKLVVAEEDAAELSYDWSAPGQPKQTVYLFFVRENDRWVVAYNLNLLRQVEDAIKQSDPDLALLDSQEAVRVNPRDPMARAYLCEAAYFRKMPEQAGPACKAALDLAAKYPSNLSEQSLAHLKIINAELAQGK